MDRITRLAPGSHELEHHDREQALAHKLDRVTPDRGAPWPKDDRRSSSRLLFDSNHLTRTERSERWPIG